MPEPPADAELLLPLGRFHGVRQQGTRFDVRLGADLHELDATRFAVWAGAHGVPERAGEPWTAATTLTTVQAAGLPGAAGALDALRADGLLAHAAPGGPSARALADRVRLMPALLGLGNSADDPGVWSLGLPGRPMVSMDAALYDLVCWAHMDGSLWRACEGSTAVARRAGAPGADEGPEALLTRAVGSLHALLSANAVYLDTWGVAA